jgi:glycosyltransferase involved in cell wall biosynthesis
MNSTDRSDQSVIVYLVSEDWYFRSHRLVLAKAAVAQGYRVVLITRVSQYRAELESHGIELVALNMSRNGLNPLAELQTLFSLIRCYRSIRPTVAHHVALKPAIYGSIAARLAGVSRIINAFGGLGLLFSADGPRYRALKALLLPLLRQLFKSDACRLILQNPDDIEVVNTLSIAPALSIHLIRGAGVDLQRFVPKHGFGAGFKAKGSECVSSATAFDAKSPLRIVLAARMLWDKGIAEFVEAAGVLTTRVDVECILVGAPDTENPKAIPEKQLRDWHDSGVVTWLGYRDDMAAILREVDIACLPSFYGEGIPKSLLEACAAGLPIVTTDMPGCRETVEHNKNGLLVPPRDVSALVAALEHLLDNADLRYAMGQASRQKAEREFSDRAVCEKTLALYGGDNVNPGKVV